MLRRVAAVGVLVLLCYAVAGGVVPAMADQVGCIQVGWTGGECTVGVGTGGSPGSPAAPGGGSVPVAAQCTDASSGVVVPCQDASLGWWDQGLQCYAALASPQPPKTDPAWQGHTEGAVYLCTSVNMPGSGTGVVEFWAGSAPAGPGFVDPVVLARQALSTLVVPGPVPGRYPAGTLQDGRPFTLVNIYTWFWTDPAAFRVLTARASVGGAWAQVTVTPTGLSFTPGDGSPAVSCAGPGVAWDDNRFGPYDPSPVGCEYRYPHSSIHQPHEMVTATYGISWSVTWTSSTGASGTLPPLTTRASATFAVAEAEAVVIK